MSDQRFWVSDNGEVTCEKHGGMYLISAINAKPKAVTHKTPLGSWSLYFTHLTGGENLECESCAYSQARAGA
jgi:hypothetical protein